MNLRIVFVFLVIILFSCNCFACPEFNRIPDFNCDGKTVVTITGDSLAYGTGDTVNDNKGGYPLRLGKKLSNITVNNQGVSGLRSREFLTLLSDTFDHNLNASLLSDLTDSDIVIIDLGRNDRWLFGTPIATYRNLKRAATKIRNEVSEITGSAPMVVIAVIMLPNRGAQGPWVKELDALILKGSTGSKPSDLRFDLVSKRLISNDGVHPTSKGYTALAKALQTYLVSKLAPKMRALRPDSDSDGIPDLFEERYGTLVDNPDTDGDTKFDGDEVFTLNTDPLVSD